MISTEEIKKYLPTYLSSESNEQLFKQIDSGKIDDNYYAFECPIENKILQGDGLNSIIVFNSAPAIVLSNTCDIDSDNRRMFQPNMVYAPIFNLEKYRLLLIEESLKTDDGVDAHINSIRRQEITQIFYLPQGSGMKYEGIVFLDRLLHYPIHLLTDDDIHQRKMFTLSNFGFYSFLVKLNIHFTRVKEGIDRDKPAEQ
jgi:hypothetical protein